MEITYLNLEGIDLRSGDFSFYPRNLLDTNNEIVTNDFYSTGVGFNRKKQGPRKFVLNGFIKNESQRNWEKLNHVLNKDGLLKLVVGMQGLTTKTLDVVVENVIFEEPYLVKLSISLIAPDPRMYSLDEQVIDLTGTSENALVYPITYPIKYGNITGLKGSLVNAGNTTAYPRFEIYGPCTNIVLKNNTTGQTMIFNITLDVSDILEIDCAPKVREIRLNGIKRMDLRNGEWLTCLPGVNEIEIQRTSLVGNSAMAFLRSAWQ